MAGVISLSMIALATPRALAVEDRAESVASLISRVAPDEGPALAGTPSADGVGFQTEDVAIAVPSQMSDGVVISSDEGQMVAPFPSGLSVGNGTTADDGTIVYPNDGHDADVAVQALDDGSVRLQTIIPSADATHSFSYQFDDDVSLVQVPEGIELRREGPDGGVSLGVIAPAWARDADGNQVPTRYEVDANTLVQVIDASPTATYPVVADPRVSFGVGVYFYGFGAEWIALATALTAAGGGAVVGACLVVNIPNPWAAVLKAACGTIGASNMNNYLDWVRSAINSSQLKPQTCYEFRRFTTVSGPKAVKRSHCLR
ncbi:hypothetical protein [Cellulomonas triticagri]|uniref:Uncharacterized protein n=1 Tax=Cellulomonas triticagri TaxID=2483352 RepID=A0A3M2JHD5_9CELL|nr:hypothetical protein [Cellulomonas triticagri]RMI12999.1 hypothetical protein EBM89_06225 [Cellulomonas triticagri]